VGRLVSVGARSVDSWLEKPLPVAAVQALWLPSDLARPVFPLIGYVRTCDSFRTNKLVLVQPVSISGGVLGAC
jgi:hypothetical protein